jgi:adenylate cyclase class 2
MPIAFEREIKLRFADAGTARAAVAALGAAPLRGRRLQSDMLFDTPDGSLGARRSVLRARRDGDREIVTFKNPSDHAVLKVREEIETLVGDLAASIAIFEQLGLRCWFRYEKYREELALGDVVIAIDETPVGTFVEIEGSESGIASTAAALGRSPADYIVESYRALFVRHCAERGIPATDMVFPPA